MLFNKPNLPNMVGPPKNPNAHLSFTYRFSVHAVSTPLSLQARFQNIISMSLQSAGNIRGNMPASYELFMHFKVLYASRHIIFSSQSRYHNLELTASLES